MSALLARLPLSLPLPAPIRAACRNGGSSSVKTASAVLKEAVPFPLAS